MKNKLAALRENITFLYVFLALVPMVMVLAINTHSYSEMMRSEVSITVLQLLRQAGINISNTMDTAKRVSDSLFMNEDINAALTTAPERQPLNIQWQEMQRLRHLLDTAYQSPSIVSARLFVNGGKSYANERINLFPLSEFEQNPLYANASAKPGFTGRYVRTTLDGQTISVISCIRYIRNLSSIGQTIGALAIDVGEEGIASLLRGIDLPWSHTIYLLSAEGNVLSSDTIAPPDSSSVAWAITKAEGVYIESGMLRVVTEVGTTGWRLVAAVPWSSVRAGFFSSRANTLMVMLSALIVVLVFTVLSSRMVGRGVRRIDELVLVFDQQDRPPPPPIPQARVRLGVYRQLDEAIGKARTLMRSLYEQMELQRSTQLKLLQAQINPHFLYNALDAVNWMVRAGRSDEAVTMITTLTRYLRLILNNGQDTVTIEDEISLAQAYLDIQRQRFGDRFDVEIILDPSAEGCLLPKLTLQPVIENALVHGIQKLEDRRGRINVDIYADQGVMVLSITDNGVGMDENATRGLLKNPAPGSSGYGLYNVHQRCQIFSGDAMYGMQVESELGKYTSVTLRLVQRKA